MTPLVGILVTVFSLANIVALVMLLASLRRRRGETAGTGETTGHVWDEDLRELNNPLPRWWLWLFVLTVVFGIAYLLIYPGLGNYGGTAGWSSEKQYHEQTVAAEAVLARTLAPFAHEDPAALARDPAALRVGRNLFMNNCSTCHGSDARGAPGFPNLTDKDWLFGGTPETIVQTISYGRDTVMPPWRDALVRAAHTDGRRGERTREIRDHLCRLPWSGCEGQPATRGPEPDRPGLVEWRGGGNGPRDDRQGAPRADARSIGAARCEPREASGCVRHQSRWR
jgi:mono/diheme cytochrome c family protein